MGIQRLVDLMETGKIDFNRRGCKIFIPCKHENLELSEKIVASNKGFQGRTVTAIISLALTTGLRFSDIANLKLSDIDWKILFSKEIYNDIIAIVL